MQRSCKGLNRKGEQCKAAPMKGSDYCSAHNTELPAETRFGTPQQAREAATGVERRFPRLRETVERKLEEKAERIVDAQLEALDATRMTVDEEGIEHVHPDYLTRLRAGDTLTSRALGKPGQHLEVDAGGGSLVNINLVTDADTRELAAALRQRLADGRTVQPSGLGAGD